IARFFSLSNRFFDFFQTFFSTAPLPRSFPRQAKHGDEIYHTFPICQIKIRKFFRFLHRPPLISLSRSGETDYYYTPPPTVCQAGIEKFSEESFFYARKTVIAG
ncbi:MAG: hypothetical protein IJS14_12875, partial [Lentisphaeria bacterium]|nr:hypothetical protein [Lentisphaeria bacterium]